MTFLAQGHAHINFAATHLEFILSQRPPNSVSGLPSEEKLEHLKRSFSRAYPVTETGSFGDLLAAIDEADEKLVRLGLDLR